MVKKKVNYKDIVLEDEMLPHFIPYITDKSRYLAFIGSRGSGKSIGAAQIIILRMMTHKFFRGIGIRRYFKDIKDSIFQNLLDLIEKWNLTEYFKINLTHYSITCTLNGNMWLSRGLDDPKSVKSISESSFVFFEEEVPETMEDFNNIDLSIRTIKADWIQTMFCLNPVLDGDPEKHWFYNFMGYDKEEGMTFERIESGVIDGEEVSYTIKSIHTSYKDNKFLRPQYKLKLEKQTDPYLYAIETLGIWGRKQVDGRFYKKFDISRHIIDKVYDPNKPLFVSIDFNAKPYLSILIAQVDGKKVYCIDEIAARTPNNYSREAIKLFIDKYNEHKDIIYLTGDASGYQRDTSQEAGYNNFAILFDMLKDRQVRDRTKRSNKSVSMRGAWINAIFEDNYGGMELYISNKCSELINDMLYGLEKSDGTKLKKEVTNKETGERYEKYFHMSDALDYLLCNNFEDEFNKFSEPSSGFDPIYIPRSYTNRI